MPTLPSGLRTFEATETVRRIAQNENIEATDALFHQTDGHRHTGQPGDGPLITKEGLASEAVTTEKIKESAVTNDKLASSSITGDKLARNTIERNHIRSSGLSSNVAKFKKVTVTGGTVSGEPTSPYTFQDTGLVDQHLWAIPNILTLPQSITIHLDREYKALEGMSFGTRFGADTTYLPRDFHIEGSTNNSSWTLLYRHSGQEYEPFSFIPFQPIGNWRYIRLTITARRSGSLSTDVSCLAVYSRYHGNVDADLLDDQRAWGLNARLQGIMIFPEGTVTDNGNGHLYLSAPLIVMNPVSGTYFRVQAGSYYLGQWGYLYVDIPFQHGVSVTASVGIWIDTGSPRGFENKNRIVLAQRQNNGNIYFHSAFQSRLCGTNPDADKVDGIDFRVSGGRLEFNHGTGWNGVGIKSVQRGTTSLQYSSSSSIYDNDRTVIISPVNMSKAFVLINQSGYQYRYQNGAYDRLLDGDVFARLQSSNELYVYTTIPFATNMYTYISWEVIEFA